MYYQNRISKMFVSEEYYRFLEFYLVNINDATF